MKLVRKVGMLRVKFVNDTYERSYVEILEILKFIPRDEFEKIPKELIEFYEKNKDKEYQYIYNPNLLKTSQKTDIILVNLYRNYIASEDKIEIVENILKLNEKFIENKKSKKYNINNIF